MSPQQAVELVEGAKVLKHLAPGGDCKAIRRLIHPDRFAGDAKMVSRAEKATYKLDSLISAANPKASAVVIGDWMVTSPLAKGDLADLHEVVSKHGAPGVLKIARSARDNDLIDAEHKALTALRPGGVDSVFQRYIPIALESLSASGRHANVLSKADGFLTLAEIIPHRPGFRHSVWMMNRALSLLGYAHQLGVVHGAVNADHLMYNPETHDMVLVDWCYSSINGSKVPAVVKAHRPDYPAEILRKETPGPYTDLYMLAKAIRHVAPVPRRFQPLFELCLLASPRSRAQNAWEFQDRWRIAAEEEYGPPQFTPLVIPVH